MKFTSAIALVLTTLPFMVSAANATDADAKAACRQVCCDALVQGVRPAGNTGINCSPDDTGDCFFGGQLLTAMTWIQAPNGAQRGTGTDCIGF
ncbi:hypothetical protein CVT25_000925 [Psilocybe cyanescens]|uniref:Extracellular membrane protein CFEM domain-containing protein n=1 Tax=Psilocybe cyanescens TaxID=93625 RepID=A0A409X8I4_PSICY|nr:hypothetical protein CVT25_000925 [Psilocybe cyanescens]